MSLAAKLRGELTAAMKAHDEPKKNLLRVIMGDMDMMVARTGSVTDEQGLKIIRKIVENDKEALEKGFYDETTKTYHEVPAEKRAAMEFEISYLETLLPKTLTYDDVKILLVASPLNLSEQKNEGAAIGSALKYLKQIQLETSSLQGINIDGKIVKEVVQELRS